MPQVFTNLLNQTITGRLNKDIEPIDSLSVRITGLCQGGYAKLFGITWNVFSDDDNGLNDTAFCHLMILRNEIFDPTFDYDAIAAENSKDVIFRDSCTGRPGIAAINTERIVDYQRHINFIPAKKLNDASNYLIIVTPAVRIGDPGTNYQVTLTVRGQVYNNDNSNTLAARKR